MESSSIKIQPQYNQPHCKHNEKEAAAGHTSQALIMLSDRYIRIITALGVQCPLIDSTNRPLGDIEHRHNYVPCQPVLSCRTVEIDLQGTRTYRPRSTVDILEEQQLLIRQLYSKQRATASAPPRHRTDPSARATPDSAHRVNIEVKGRPLTSSSQNNFRNISDQRSRDTQKRPKTTGRLKNVKPATDCFMVVRVDDELLESTRNKRKATNQIHSYWKSENHNLAVGKFVRGQKRPDDVPPTLDAWLTFGGAAGEESEGLIDAFASFKNSEEYYNIEGSVGSRVAKQLQKGDKIRIGINGVLQSSDLKVKRWNKENAYCDDGDDEDKNEVLQEIVPVDEVIEEAQKPSEEENDIITQDEDKDFDGDFKELAIDDALEDLLAESAEEEEKEMSSRKTPVPQIFPVRRSETPPREILPLSWDDQCGKADVRVINARVNLNNTKKMVMSETHPVKFEKLSRDQIRPKLAQPREDGFKVKQRTSLLKDKANGRATSSKVKIVYIDPLNKEEEEKVNSLSIEQVISDKIGTKSLETNANTNHRSINNNNDSGVITINEDSDYFLYGQRAQSSRHNPRRRRPSSNSSAVSERSNGIPSPKIKTPVISSSHHPEMVGNLSITTPGARYSSVTNEMPPRSSKTPGRISQSKPLHRPGTGNSSIKSGPIQGETEFIKITTQLKIPSTPGNQPVSSSNSQPASLGLYDYRPGSNTPQDRARSPFGADSGFLANDEVQSYNKDNLPELKSSEVDEDRMIISQDLSKIGNDDNNNSMNNEDHSLSESPAPTTVAISIPTADELSDRDSLTNSPSRQGTGTDNDLTQFQKRERNLRNEQINQLTDLLGNAIVDT